MRPIVSIVIGTLCAASLAACGLGQPAACAKGCEICPPGCYGPSWAPVMIGIVPPDGVQGDPISLVASIQARDSTGLLHLTAGCPATGTLPCNLSTGSMENSVTVTAVTDAGTTLTTQLSIGLGRLCGQNEGYALLSLKAGAEHFLAPQQITLCN